MNSLTKEDVRALIESGELEHCNEMDFSSYTHIEEDAAKCIAEEGGGAIFFWNTPHFTISDDAASWLVQCGEACGILFEPSEKLTMSVEAAQIFADDIIRLGKDYGNDFYTFKNCSKDVVKVLRTAGLSKGRGGLG